MDSSLVQADASNNSVVNKESLKRYLNKSYQILESRLEQEQQSCSRDDHPKSGAANSKYISATDPDASVTRRGSGKSTLKYQIHNILLLRAHATVANLKSSVLSPNPVARLNATSDKMI